MVLLEDGQGLRAVQWRWGAEWRTEEDYESHLTSGSLDFFLCPGLGVALGEGLAPFTRGESTCDKLAGARDKVDLSASVAPRRVNL